MGAALILGFLIGMQHALEADHIAAVSSIVARETEVRRIVRHGVVWGLGHTLTLLVFAGGALVLNTTISGNLATVLELAVGVMLVVLGGQLLVRLVRERVHIHLHRHPGGAVHLHAHSHRGEVDGHDPDHHRHSHSKGFPLRTLAVGLMHGMAGSAALLILTVSAMPSPLLALVYLALFGIGSIVGMAALSAVISVPLGYSARLLSRGRQALELVIGVATVGLGAATIYASSGSLGLPL